MNDISRKWEKWFHTCITLIAYNLCNDEWILLKFGRLLHFVYQTGIVGFSLLFWAIWRQNFDNLFLGHTVSWEVGLNTWTNVSSSMMPSLKRTTVICHMEDALLAKPLSLWFMVFHGQLKRASKSKSLVWSANITMEIQNRFTFLNVQLWKNKQSNRDILMFITWPIRGLMKDLVWSFQA